jgi:lycopene cyclase CruA
MVAAAAKSRTPHASPDLSDFRKRYPLTVANFGSLADREQWLRRIWEADARWQQAMADESGRAGSAHEAIVKGAPPASLSVEAEFEIIYAGGELALLHAGVMACRHNRRVMVFGERGLEAQPRGWNISNEELAEFERAGLFTKEEIAAAIVNRYRSSLVKFHDTSSRIKAPTLWIEGVLDVSLDAGQLLESATRKIQRSKSASVLMEGMRFVRCYVQADRVAVEVEEMRTGRRKLFGARLFVDATGATSPVARQLNDGRAMTHVRPTVGTIARGFVRGTEPDRADFGVGEILVSREDARDHRQLMWEGFGGNARRDEYQTSLFFYDAVKTPADKSLLSLFEKYFEALPAYKRAGAQWRVLKPIFGFAPGFHARGRRSEPGRSTENRVLLIGDAAAASASRSSCCGFGAQARSLRRVTHLIELALKANLLDGASLAEINNSEPRVAPLANLSELMRPAPRSAPPVVNETMNALMSALHDLDERVRREFFQDRMSLGAFKNLLTRTFKLYPRIFHHAREQMGTRGTFWWLAGIAESMLHERRRGRARTPVARATDEEDAIENFASAVAFYQNDHAGEA